jgi:ribonucleoside-diphosphate reductase alpha chain
MKLTGVAEKVFLDRYSRKDLKGNPIESSPEEMWRRIADAVDEKEKAPQRKKWADSFYEAMDA